MRRAVALLLLLALGACAGGGASGPYVGGAVGANVREDARSR
jgi:hypothetical protein